MKFFFLSVGTRRLDLAKPKLPLKRLKQAKDAKLAQYLAWA